MASTVPLARGQTKYSGVSRVFDDRVHAIRKRLLLRQLSEFRRVVFGQGVMGDVPLGHGRDPETSRRGRSRNRSAFCCKQTCPAVADGARTAVRVFRTLGLQHTLHAFRCARRKWEARAGGGQLKSLPAVLPLSVTVTTYTIGRYHCPVATRLLTLLIACWTFSRETFIWLLGIWNQFYIKPSYDPSFDTLCVFGSLVSSY